MKNGLRLASLLAALAIVAAACSGGGGTAAPAGSEPATSAAPGACRPGGAMAALPEGDFALTMWTKEGEADGTFQYVKSLTDAYIAAHPNATFEVVKDVEALRRRLPDLEPGFTIRRTCCGPCRTIGARSTRLT